MKLLLLLLMGIVAATVDVLPMVKMKIDKYSTVSAFVYHIIAPFILYYVDVAIPFWLKGGVIYLILALPMIILVARDDKKSVPIMGATSLVIGTIIGVAQHVMF